MKSNFFRLNHLVAKKPISLQRRRSTLLFYQARSTEYLHSQLAACAAIGPSFMVGCSSIHRRNYAKMHDLSKYSLAQLRALEVQVIDELKTQHFLSISKAREQILHIARNAGLSEKQLRAIKVVKTPKQSNVQVKYRNPENPDQQWSGRGRQPVWIKTLLASGKSLEDVSVNKGCSTDQRVELNL